MENVTDTVNDLLLSHKGALKCIKPRVKLQGRPAFIYICYFKMSSNVTKFTAMNDNHNSVCNCVKDAENGVSGIGGTKNGGP